MLSLGQVKRRSRGALFPEVPTRGTRKVGSFSYGGPTKTKCRKSPELVSDTSYDATKKAVPHTSLQLRVPGTGSALTPALCRLRAHLGVRALRHMGPPGRGATTSPRRSPGHPDSPVSPETGRPDAPSRHCPPQQCPPGFQCPGCHGSWLLSTRTSGACAGGSQGLPTRLPS